MFMVWWTSTNFTTFVMHSSIILVFDHLHSCRTSHVTPPSPLLCLFCVGCPCWKLMFGLLPEPLSPHSSLNLSGMSYRCNHTFYTLLPLPLHGIIILSTMLTSYSNATNHRIQLAHFAPITSLYWNKIGLNYNDDGDDNVKMGNIIWKNLWDPHWKIFYHCF